MRIRIVVFAVLTACGMASARVLTQSGNASSATVDFARDIQPILEQRCYACHTGTSPRGQLRLDAGALALQGGSSGLAIVAGNSRASLLIHRLNGEGGQPRMPMGGTLSADEIAVIARWIDQGANWPASTVKATAQPTARHWAYVKPVRPMLPVVRDAAWAQNPIDRFVAARLEKEGLHPSPGANRETLVRRLSRPAACRRNRREPSPHHFRSFLCSNQT